MSTAEAYALVKEHKSNTELLDGFERYYHRWVRDRVAALNKSFSETVAPLRADEDFMSTVRGLCAP